MAERYYMVRVTEDTHQLLQELQSAFQASFLKGHGRMFWSDHSRTKPPLNDLIRELCRRVKEHRDRSRGRAGRAKPDDCIQPADTDKQTNQIIGLVLQEIERREVTLGPDAEDLGVIDLEELRRSHMTPGELASAEKAGRDRGNT